MADQPNVFQTSVEPGTQTTQPVKDSQIPVLTLPDQVKELVGEGKKYATVEDALKALPHSQSHIQKLETEMSELRKELEGRLSLEEAVAQLKAEGKPAEIPSAMIDQKALSKLVVDTVAGLEVSKKAETNLLAVDKRMKELFGEKAQEKLIDKAKELGVSIAHLKTTAEQSPQAFFNLTGIKQEDVRVPAKTGSSVNTEQLASTSVAKEGTYNYYQDIRRKNPTLYFSPKMQNEMHRKAKELGGAFFDN